MWDTCIINIFSIFSFFNLSKYFLKIDLNFNEILFIEISIYAFVLNLTSVCLPQDVLLLSSSEAIWRRKWQPTPVLLPGKSHGQRSLVGYSPWGR